MNQRSELQRGLATCGLMLATTALGVGAGWALTPGQPDLGAFIGAVTIVVGWALGIACAYAYAVVTLLYWLVTGKLFRQLRASWGRSREPEDAADRADDPAREPEREPGWWVFLPASTLSALTGGLILGLFETSRGVAVCTSALGGVGLLNGLVIWALGWRARLAMPDIDDVD